jgi:Zn finger protein HypA/HybF involved in hydrogenase expression
MVIVETEAPEAICDQCGNKFRFEAGKSECEKCGSMRLSLHGNEQISFDSVLMED